MTNTELKNRLSKSVEFLKAEVSQVRTGRANPSLLEDISIDAYDSKMLLKELGSITLADSHTIVISPWDKNLLSKVAKTIRESDLNLNPVEVGDSLRVPIPPLTEERRKELTKVVSQKVEDCKQSIRNIRQEAMKDIDKAFEDKEISEDAKFSQKEDVEDTVKEHTQQAEELGVNKNEELLKV